MNNIARAASGPLMDLGGRCLYNGIQVPERCSRGAMVHPQGFGYYGQNGRCLEAVNKGKGEKRESLLSSFEKRKPMAAPGGRSHICHISPGYVK
ncbi:hypothetical protein SAMN06265218_1163 [Fodinibius sediminis]|uniref:Uncharacterized protein n=1 Tax=Fodinibius sediminis TaxID=1214077 RepID=A0A521EEY2_9BACT|nr:hypothetical protein SAMN06265218_1163 [Fodinibius sediminis]